MACGMNLLLANLYCHREWQWQCNQATNCLLFNESILTSNETKKAINLQKL